MKKSSCSASATVVLFEILLLEHLPDRPSCCCYYCYSACHLLPADIWSAPYCGTGSGVGDIDQLVGYINANHVDVGMVWLDVCCCSFFRVLLASTGTRAL